ncbi:TetR/AcrR family transcriptional regulator [Propionibacteriaceae bacterium Y1700]|uniref:TetR/AcrR family transcriptional regulator n=1 Tax=Microlunatus sp. Y1700 TaxID=3418487 RepID=UPI003DA79F76
MSRPPVARQKLLDAFIRILIDEGERAATVEAVAARAGVSKGGLLYHFGSKNALVEGLLDLLSEAAEADVVAMRAAPEGAVAHYLRTSGTGDDQLKDLYVAASRLTQDHGRRAGERLAAIEQGWYAVLVETVGDPVRAKLIQLIGDGLYLNSIVADQAAQSSTPTAELITAVDTLIVRPQ